MFSHFTLLKGSIALRTMVIMFVDVFDYVSFLSWVTPCMCSSKLKLGFQEDQVTMLTPRTCDQLGPGLTDPYSVGKVNNVLCTFKHQTKTKLCHINA